MPVAMRFINENLPMYVFKRYRAIDSGIQHITSTETLKAALKSNLLLWAREPLPDNADDKTKTLRNNITAHFNV